MCGRFTLVPGGAERVPEVFDVRGPAPPPRWNAAPRQELAVVRARPREEGASAGDPVAPTTDAGRELAMLQWGLVPAWTRELAKARRPINARAETVREKPSFRDAFRRRRCLVPASGWYEWTAPEGGADRRKQGWLLWPADGGSPDEDSLFAFAGLWERWAVADQVLETVVLLTAAARPEAAQVHDRMPVVLRPDEHARWLGAGDEEAAAALLEPAGRPVIRFRRVGPWVNSAAHEDPRCIAPAAGLFDGA